MAQINQDLLLLQLRATAFGVGYSDLLAANRSAKDWASWSEKIAEFAARYEGLAEGADKHPKSAEQWWQTTANYYHFAQMFVQGERKLAYQAKSRRAYDRFAALTQPTAQRICIPYNDLELPGYLRIASLDAPLVILRGGLEFAKEVEMHQLGQPFVERGMSVLTFDMPGEGELAGHGRSAEQFERMMMTVFDYLAVEGIVTDTTPIGIWGASSGAYFALRTAAMTQRITACISAGGFVSGETFFNLAHKNREMFATLIGVKDSDSVNDSTSVLAPLTSLPQPPACPTLLIHGGNDHLVPLAHFEQLQEWTQGETDAWLLPESGHVCYDRFEVLLPVSADWMAAKLSPQHHVAPVVTF